MELKEVVNMKSGKITRFIDGRRVPREEYARHDRPRYRMDCFCSWSFRGRLYFVKQITK